MTTDYNIALHKTDLWPAQLLNFTPPVDPEKVSEEVYKLKNIYKEGIVKSNNGGWQSPPIYNNDLSDQFHHITTVRKFSQTAVEYIAETLCNPFRKSKVISCEWWANVNKKDDYNVMHHHGAVYLTCIYYAQLPSKPGELIIKSPLDYGHCAWYSQRFITPSLGSVYILPGSYMHMVTPNITNELDRISIAFNFDIDADPLERKPYN